VAVVRLRGLAGGLGLLALVALGLWAGTRAWAAIHWAAAVGSLRGRVVAIDPGHGGVDPGAIGPRGITEDAVVWAVSQDLTAMLQRAGAVVLLTRGTNGEPVRGTTTAGPATRRRLDLRTRVAQLNARGADVVLSIHANHFTDPRAHGAQTFYGSSQRAESKLLAGLVQEQLAVLTGETRRLISDEVNHYLLRAAAMPAVTVEIGFLSNPREAALLADPTYQRRIAYALFVALAYWFAQRHAPVGGAP